jgi:hypothetical protein
VYVVVVVVVVVVGLIHPLDQSSRIRVLQILVQFSLLSALARVFRTRANYTQSS